MKIDKQRLRNLTTGRLHTEIGHIYTDYGYITGIDAIFTHMLPNIHRALEPWLREKVTDLEYWDGEWKPELNGEYDLPEMTIEEKAEFFTRYVALPHPFSLLGTKNETRN